MWKARSSINRIRLEFKDGYKSNFIFHCLVLIESDWNLKNVSCHKKHNVCMVLIESDWNLKTL